jgi:hypothetical protein
MATTQEHIPIKEISDDVVFLKDGSGALVLQVSAVNFGLLSEGEQIGIIDNFAQMLNSLSFSIQIVIYSKRLNISSYLLLLDKAREVQVNPLLSKMMTEYRQFIQKLIKENEVLDKKFYVVIPLFQLELGLGSSKERLTQKIKTILLPRRDQVIRQLARGGLKATQLDSEKLLELFFDIYNEVSIESIRTQPTQLNAPQSPSPATSATQQPVTPLPKETIQPIPQTSPMAPAPPTQPIVSQPSASRTHPFVTEELEENV